MDEPDREIEWLPPVPTEPERPPGAGPALPSEPPTPPGYYYVPSGGYPPYPTTGLPGHDTRPSNGDAVAGFVLSCVSLGLLVFSSGLSSVISITCAILGLVYARKGKRRAGAADLRHNGLAQAGFIVGLVALVGSVLATAGWTLALILDT